MASSMHDLNAARGKCVTTQSHTFQHIIACCTIAAGVTCSCTLVTAIMASIKGRNKLNAGSSITFKVHPLSRASHHFPTVHRTVYASHLQCNCFIEVVPGSENLEASKTECECRRGCLNERSYQVNPPALCSTATFCNWK